jgi:predicted permease
MRVLIARLVSVWRRRRADADFDEEIEAHLQLLARRYVREGQTPAQARLAARRQFGSAARLIEDRRSLQTLPSLEQVSRAVRLAIRQLRRSPVFTVTALLSLALGIGVTTAVFTLLDQLVLRRLPVAEPQQLVMIWSTGPSFGSSRGGRVSSFSLCQDYQRQAAAFDSVFCRYDTPSAIAIDGAAEPIRAELVSGNYFAALRVGARIGRVLSATEDDRVDRGHPVVVLSHRFWLDRFAGRTDVVGRTVLLNHQPLTIVGVAAAGFSGLDAAEAPHLWLPLRMKALITPAEDGLNDRDYHFVQVFGRLKPDQTIASARASLQPLFSQILQQEVLLPDLARASAFDRDRFLKRTVIVEPAASGYSESRQRYRTALFVLMGMTGLMLAIACSNVASLLVARGFARQRDLSVRLAIGASRAALVGHLLTESLLLSSGAAALGIGFSVAITRALLAMLPATDALLLLRAEPDWRILGFSIGVSVATGVVFGLLPALQATRLDVSSRLRASAAGLGAATQSTRLRKALVTAQVALSFLLLVGAGLFARTLFNLRHLDTGLQQVDQVLSFQIDPTTQGYSPSEAGRFYADLVSRIDTLPGVNAAAYAWIPLLQGWAPTWNMRIEGYAPGNGEDMEVASNIVSPGYWRAMGVRFVEGRAFDERDRLPSDAPGQLPTVAVVNRSFVARFFRDGRVLDRRLGIGENKGALAIRIIGVVEDALQAGPRTGLRPQVYFSFLQANYPVSAVFYVRTSVAPDALAPVLRRLVAQRDATLPITAMKTLGRQLDDTLSAERMIAWLSVVFAGLATVMAALGLYGVMAFAVAGRTKEIGLRTALGASPGSVSWLVMREVLVLVAAGLALGLPAAVLLGRAVASQLFGVAAGDVTTVATAGAVLALSALAAGLLPARRASTIDPLIALRHE